MSIRAGASRKATPITGAGRVFARGAPKACQFEPNLGHGDI